MMESPKLEMLDEEQPLFIEHLFYARNIIWFI